MICLSLSLSLLLIVAIVKNKITVFHRPSANQHSLRSMECMRTPGQGARRDPGRHPPWRHIREWTKVRFWKTGVQLCYLDIWVDTWVDTWVILAPWVIENRNVFMGGSKSLKSRSGDCHVSQTLAMGGDGATRQTNRSPDCPTVRRIKEINLDKTLWGSGKYIEPPIM